jgi:hypothetical protein
VRAPSSYFAWCFQKFDRLTNADRLQPVHALCSTRDARASPCTPQLKDWTNSIDLFKKKFVIQSRFSELRNLIAKLSRGKMFRENSYTSTAKSYVNSKVISTVSHNMTSIFVSKRSESNGNQNSVLLIYNVMDNRLDVQLSISFLTTKTRPP